MHHLLKKTAALPFADMGRGRKLLQGEFLPVVFMQEIEQYGCALLFLRAVINLTPGIKQIFTQQQPQTLQMLTDQQLPVRGGLSEMGKNPGREKSY